MKSRTLSNALAVVLLLVGCAGFTWYASKPTQPPPPPQASPAPKPGKTAPQSPKPVPEAVVVKVLDQPFHWEESQLDGLLFEEFANKADESQFESYTSANWTANFEVFAAAMVRKADNQRLDSAALRSVLGLVLGDSKGLAYLPVGAYQATLNDKLVWIITVKWESPEMGEAGLGHIRIYVFDQRTLKQVAFVTCS